jgi:hypothetical protein
MAQFGLTMEEATRGELPLVCMTCGEPAIRHSVWEHGRQFFRLPLCPRHEEIYRRQRLWGGCFFASLLPLVIFVVLLAVAVIAAIVNPWPQLEIFLIYVLFLCVGVVGLVAMAGFLLVYQSAVIFGRVNRREAIMWGVSPIFIEALRFYRQSPGEVRLGEPSPATTAAGLGDGRFKLAESALQALASAVEQAAVRRHHQIGSLHLLFGLGAVAGGAADTLHTAGIEPEQLMAELDALPAEESPTTPAGDLPITPLLRRIFERANRHVQQVQNREADATHLLAALLREREGESDSDALVYLRLRNLDPQKLL